MVNEETATIQDSTTGIQGLTQALVNLFRDDEKKDIIFTIVGDDEKTLDNLIKAAAAYLIIYQYELEYPGETPVEKSDNLYQELKSLFGDTIGDSIKIQEKSMGFFTSLFELQLKTPAIKVNEKRKAILSDLEGDLIEILRTFPEYYFFDFIEGLMEIASLSRKIARREGKAATEGLKEIFSFNLFRKTVIEFLRIRRLKDLELLYQPIKKLAQTVHDQNIEGFPISRRGMDAFYNANQFKNEVLAIFKEANAEGQSLDEIFQKIHAQIQEQLRKAAELSSNDLIYYLQNLLGTSFTKVVDLLKSYGIQDLTLVGTALTTDYTKLEYQFCEKGIEKTDIDKVLKYDGNITGFVEVSLDDYKRSRKDQGFSDEDFAGITIQSIIQDHLSDVANPALGFLSSDLNLTEQELVDLLLLEVNIKEIVRSENLRSMNHLVMVLKLQKFIDSITEEIFISMLAKLTRQVARIVEFFLSLGKIKKDMFQTIADVVKSEQVQPRHQLRMQNEHTGVIMQLQDNVSYLLNKNDPFDVNAFIHGKLCELTYDDALKDLKEGNSPLYFGIVDHPIVLDDLDIVSHVSALDLYFRCRARKSV
ncbi:MAG TPA: hypothetical protein VKM55_27605 [Candidatus Lokiarchaeia archaeon]|nr:hypothetical protein [Candidatus Lokiarchaeia archaeon]